ncbi:MAG: DNA polymerase III subunit beta [Candidatus Omnitrophica bacterium]|nr:DNA polymerase III subunit beta [Candidatus Omnitrophota bacterium]
MKFHALNQVLSRGVNAVKNAVGSPISNPIVENIHVSCKEGKIFFMATNLNLTIRCEGELEIEEPGEIILNSEEITKIVQDLPLSEVIIETEEENVKIKCGRFKAKIKGQSADLFPPFIALEEGSDLHIENKKIKNIIRKTIFTTSAEKSRYELNGIKFHLKDKRLNCVSTDGRRLAIYSIQNDAFPSEEKSIMIPEKTLEEVVRILPDEGMATIRFGERKTQFSSGDIQIISNNLTDNFPNYDRIIPPEGNIKIKMNRSAFYSSIKRASNLSSKDTNMVILTFEDGNLEITAEREETGSEGHDQIEADYKGEKMQVRFNHNFIREFLQSLEDEEVELEMRDIRKPCIFRAVGENEYKYVLMPMRPPDEE